MSDTTEASTDVEPAAEVEVEVDETREAVVERFRTDLGEGFVDSHLQPGDDVWIRVAATAWREAGLLARDRLGCGYFEFLSAIDWLPSPFGKSEDSSLEPPREPDTTIVTGYAGGDTRFQLLARVLSLPHGPALTLKADLPDDELIVDTWVPIYAGADWHEREAHEMYGIEFRGHPNLVNLYLPGAFEGYPLRKDFPLLARQVKPWPGIVDVEPMPDEDEDAEAEATPESEASS